jgi:hypothetical protein
MNLLPGAPAEDYEKSSPMFDGNCTACKKLSAWRRAVSAAILMPVLMIVISASPSTAVRIYDDNGGQIGNYLAKYKALRVSGERLEIDGTCASVCTMLLGMIPRQRICVTPRAILAFHAAWDPMPEGDQAVNTAGNHYLWSSYPADVRKWISRHGGLRPQIIYLHGAELQAMYPTCR